MKINSINNLNFRRSLKADELREYQNVIKEGKKLTGQDGKTIFIMPSPNLPQDRAFNSGAGSYSSQYAQNFLDYMKNYIDFNVVEDLPPGQITPRGDFYCSYDSSSLALGDQQINPELLATSQFENILDKKDLNEISNANEGYNKEYLVNFKNVISPNGKQNQILKKAYKNFLKLDESSKLKEKFENYKKENEFWLNFKRESEPDQEFFKFKQFLADEHLKIGKEALNKKGIKLCGDCPLNFSQDEINAFPKAFKKGFSMGLSNWNIKALDFDSILDKSSDAHKLFKAKIQLFAKRYDMIRFDVGWGYIAPIMNSIDKKEEITRKELGSSLLEEIETWVKEIKGKDYDLKNLIWEVEAGPSEFSPFKNKKLIPALKDRTKLYSSTYMHKSKNGSWGYYDEYLNRGMTRDTLYYGIGNHDPQPLAQIAKNMPDKNKNGSKETEEFHKQGAIDALSGLLKIDPKELDDPKKFKDAKWADTMSAKNSHMFYMDVFGREERFNKQGYNIYVTPEENFAYKVPVDYKRSYHESLQNGLGFNLARAIELNMKSKGLDKKAPALFEKIQNFANILEEKEVWRFLNFVLFSIGSDIAAWIIDGSDKYRIG